jgi:hypothetical protein
VFDLVGKPTDRNGVPSLALRDHARCRHDAAFAFSALPVFPLGDPQPSISQAKMIDTYYRCLTI